MLQTKISIHASNIPVKDALKIIRDSSGIAFSYNSELIPDEQIITIHANDKVVDTILREIFKNSNLSFLEMNEQVIIYETGNKYSESENEKNINKRYNKVNDTIQTNEPEIVKEKVIIYDTIINTKIDTITILHYDTIHLLDTIIIKKHRERKKAPVDRRQRARFYIPTRMDLRIYSQWSLEVYASGMYSLISTYAVNEPQHAGYKNIVKDAETGVLSYSFGSNLLYNFKSFQLQTGLMYTRIVRNFKYSYSDTSGIVSELDSYNYYSFIDIPFMIGGEFRLSDKLDMSATGGIITGLFINAKGKTLSVNDLSEFTILDNNDFARLRYSLAFNIGFYYRVNNMADAMLQLYSRNYLSSLYNKDYPFTFISNDMGLRAGVRIYL